MVQTLVSPMSTCQRAPDDAPASLVELRCEETDPAELGLQRLFATGFVIPPALEVIRNTFGAFLKTSSHNSSLVINLTDDQNRADNARRQTLQNNHLVVVNWDL